MNEQRSLRSSREVQGEPAGQTGQGHLQSGGEEWKEGVAGGTVCLVGQMRKENEFLDLTECASS